METDILQQIECRVCHQTKPLSEFVKDKGYKGGYRNECKECKEKRIKGYLKKWEEERSKNTIPKIKECKDCHQIKPVSDYTKDKYSKDGLSYMCRDCKSKKQQALAEKWKKERSQRKGILQEKRCIKCNRILPLSRFSGNICSKDGLSSICRECQNKQAKEYKERWKKELFQNLDAITQKECPSCHHVLNVSDFYQSNSHKDGLSFYCKECELKNQKKHRDKWEIDRALGPVKIPKEKVCNICNRVLPASNFYKNRSLKDGLHSTCIQCEKSRQRDYMRKWVEVRSKDVNIPEEKECVTCHRVLPVSMFYKNIRRKDGLTSWCVDCEKKMV